MDHKGHMAHVYQQILEELRAGPKPKIVHMIMGRLYSHEIVHLVTNLDISAMQILMLS